MREDMFKVIVERPRLVHSNPYKRDGRKFRNQEDAPMRMGMQRGYGERKYFNENLAPLQRYLESQVNRPWDKVYSEIRAQIDSRSTVKQHVLQHLDHFVARHTFWREDENGGHVEVRDRGWGAEILPLSEARVKLYVHPKSGLLLRSKEWLTPNERYAHLRRKAEEDANLHQLNPLQQLRRIDGIWYLIDFAEIPGPQQLPDGTFENAIVWDVLQKRHCRRGQYDWYERYGKLYACGKRQLSARELKQHDLV